MSSIETKIKLDFERVPLQDPHQEMEEGRATRKDILLQW